jgi:hypothetical protein
VTDTTNGQPMNLADQITNLRRARAAGEPIAAGRLLGLPDLPDGDVWVDTAGASALTGVPVKTITSWLLRGAPVDYPFPSALRMLYRRFWRASEVEAWRREANRRQTTTWAETVAAAGCVVCDQTPMHAFEAVGDGTRGRCAPWCGHPDATGEHHDQADEGGDS